MFFFSKNPRKSHIAYTTSFLGITVEKLCGYMEVMTEETAGRRPTKVEEEEDGRKSPIWRRTIGKRGVSAIDNGPKKKYRLDDGHRLKNKRVR